MSGEDESAAEVTANVTLVGDSVNKLIRIRGAHRGAYTKLERKVDALAAYPISTDLELMDAEALLKTLKTKYLTIRRYDAEVELKIDDDKLDDDNLDEDDLDDNDLDDNDLDNDDLDDDDLDDNDLDEKDIDFS